MRDAYLIWVEEADIPADLDFFATGCLLALLGSLGSFVLEPPDFEPFKLIDFKGSLLGTRT